MTVCIFGSASPTLDEIYYSETEALARILAGQGHDLVFGAGKYGVMGAAAKGFMEKGAHVTGVAPKFFIPRGVVLEECDELVHHDTMAERKTYMEARSDVFVVAPGGIGTLEELFEVLTLNNLGQLDKPVIIFNINDFYTPLLAFLEDSRRQGFISDKVFDVFSVAVTPEETAELVKKKTEKENR